MLIKYIVILYFITLDYYYGLSIRKDIESAKKVLKFHGIPDKDLCKKEYINKLCSSDQKEVCSARLWGNKMEFKQFDNPCYMDLDNLCESQDGIWAIKNSGPCKINAEMRRFAKDIEKMANSSNTDSNTEEDATTDDTNDEVTYETTTDENESVTESANDEADTDANDNDDDEVTYETTTDDTKVTDVADQGTTDDMKTTNEVNVTENTGLKLSTGEEIDVADQGTTDDMKITNEVNVTENTGLKLSTGEEIGNIVYDDGSTKPVFRERTRFPPMRAEKTFNKKLCSTVVRPCPNMYKPMCLYYMRESPYNITYYYFINMCEAQQYTCYHPEHKVEGISSMRAGYCAHAQYMNYSRYVHTMSAWGHYGWLRGPWPFNRILKPHERV